MTTNLRKRCTKSANCGFFRRRMLVVLGAFDFASLIISVAPSSRCAPPPLLHAAAPSAAELMLVACKVARLAEVQEMPLALRMPSTFALVDAAFEALPQVGAVAREGGPDDECQLYDALVEGLDSRLTEVCDSLGGLDGLTPQQREGLVAGVVEVLFGDSILTEQTWAAVDSGEQPPPREAPFAPPLIDPERLSALAGSWAETLELGEGEARELLDGVARAISTSMPWPVARPLARKLYDESERLHAHMRLLVAQALPLPEEVLRLPERSRDSLVLAVLEAALESCNLYALESALLTTMAQALLRSEHSAGAEADEPALESRARLAWQIIQHDREGQRLRDRLTAMEGAGGG